MGHKTMERDPIALPCNTDMLLKEYSRGAVCLGFSSHLTAAQGSTSTHPTTPMGY